ncbi:hypothetical protein [Futiania mangrovi]|uniref:Sel1 repeat family protein n=1 Tax=Futiania mangrovi TaxID=2959716 RepID=A0A9J6PBE6_9PROT|nr:hypothetical protein [Futiania mangrovii]MCP1337460.1 hypothetical protein [Futiania mangrovii]
MRAALAAGAALGVLVLALQAPAHAQQATSIREQAVQGSPLELLTPAERAERFARGVDAYELGEYRKAYDIWLPFARAGDPTAQHNLGLMWLLGKGVTQDPEQAALWFAQGAENGSASAATQLGLLHVRGLGVDKDYDRAAVLLDQGARGGDSLGRYNLALMYENGLGVQQDMARALDWYRLAARDGHPQARARLAYLAAAEALDGRTQAGRLPPPDPQIAALVQALEERARADGASTRTEEAPQGDPLIARLAARLQGEEAAPATGQPGAPAAAPVPTAPSPAARERVPPETGAPKGDPRIAALAGRIAESARGPAETMQSVPVIGRLEPPEELPRQLAVPLPQPKPDTRERAPVELTARTGTGPLVAADGAPASASAQVAITPPEARVPAGGVRTASSGGPSPAAVPGERALAAALDTTPPAIAAQPASAGALVRATDFAAREMREVPPEGRAVAARTAGGAGSEREAVAAPGAGTPALAGPAAPSAEAAETGRPTPTLATEIARALAAATGAAPATRAEEVARAEGPAADRTRVMVPPAAEARPEPPEIVRGAPRVLPLGEDPGGMRVLRLPGAEDPGERGLPIPDTIQPGETDEGFLTSRYDADAIMGVARSGNVVFALPRAKPDPGPLPNGAEPHGTRVSAAGAPLPLSPQQESRVSPAPKAPGTAVAVVPKPDRGDALALGREAALRAYRGGDIGRAAELWARMARAGDAESQFWLGRLYNRGEGVPQDRGFAYALWMEAAGQGYSRAVTALANLRALMSDAEIRAAEQRGMPK